MTKAEHNRPILKLFGNRHSASVAGVLSSSLFFLGLREDNLFLTKPFFVTLLRVTDFSWTYKVNFVDKIGEFSWTLLVNSCGHFVYENSSLWVIFCGHFLGECSWTFLVNFRGHLFNSNEKSYTIIKQ